MANRMDLQVDSSSASLRFIIVTALIGVLMVPLLLVNWVVSEREGFRNKALSGISKAWGGAQRVTGPLLVIPFVRRVDDTETVERITIVPRELDMHIDSRHEMRRRAIYSTPVFHLEVNATGAFEPLDLDALEARFGTARLDQAEVVVGVSDSRGLRSAALTWDGTAIALEAGGGASGSAALRGLIARDAAEGASFTLSLDLRATRRISTVPVGDRSTVAIESTWPHPSFDGRFLPDHHDIADTGFSASWTVHKLARGFPSISADRPVPTNGLPEVVRMSNLDVGFGAYEPVNLYKSVERSLKYGVLFIALTLVSILCLELLTGLRFHFVQYGVVGIALALFFITLLALAEHIGFAPGYAVAAAVLTIMIAGYAHASTRNVRLGASTAATLGGLYGVLFVLLRLESFALLVGAAILLLMLGVVMSATRRLTPESVDDGGEAALPLR
ncbi:MAG: cell envelope integrity protein CreD [Gammaproteobacteria bacterium]|nr:cell envelope integrity protein CreD [Gammaproteobacteria bacterium]MYJ75810.1 cell envelope integrity protein CreD [Gammaproteobacteria bacterium]